MNAGHGTPFFFLNTLIKSLVFLLLNMYPHKLHANIYITHIHRHILTPTQKCMLVKTTFTAPPAPHRYVSTGE